MRRFHVLMLLCSFALYLSTYGVLRATHSIMHFSNANHWHIEKRENKHDVDVVHPDDSFVEFAFKPLMVAEECFHEILNSGE